MLFYASQKGGFEVSPERNVGTYSKYASLDDKMMTSLKNNFIKFGIGRATYDSEIRNKEITREEGLNLVKKYDGEYPIRFENFEYYQLVRMIMRDFKTFERTRWIETILIYYDKFRSPIFAEENNKWKIRK